MPHNFLLHLSELSAEPLQGQIVRQIRAAILTGALSDGEVIPSIRALARDVKVSVITVQRAYAALEAEGIIRSRRGKGFYVKSVSAPDRQRLSLERLEEGLTPVIQAAVAEGLSSTAIRRAFKRILETTKRVKQMSSVAR